MNKEFVPYELALKMKALGFDEPCMKSYGDDGLLNQNDHSLYLSALLYQQAFRFFREKYRLSVLIHDCLDDYIGEIVEWTIAEDKVIHEVSNRIDTYEEAELACLEKLIEIVEQNK
jgi:hypothetical protein